MVYVMTIACDSKQLSWNSKFPMGLEVLISHPTFQCMRWCLKQFVSCVSRRKNVCSETEAAMTALQGCYCWVFLLCLIFLLTIFALLLPLSTYFSKRFVNSVNAVGAGTACFEILLISCLMYEQTRIPRTREKGFTATIFLFWWWRVFFLSSPVSLKVWAIFFFHLILSWKSKVVYEYSNKTYSVVNFQKVEIELHLTVCMYILGRFPP